MEAAELLGVGERTFRRWCQRHEDDGRRACWAGALARYRPGGCVGRALAHFGVGHIAAYSPQARGRLERVFHTLQNRLSKELALAATTMIEAATV